MEKAITIAICDDEKTIRNEIADCLRNIVSDAVIKCYDNTSGILDSDFDADILFLDIQMPGLDGMEAARKLRASGKKTVIIFVTALEEYVFKAFDVGAFQYIVKPFESEKLIEIATRAVKSVRAQEQNTIVVKQEPSESVRTIVVKSGGANLRIELERVVYAEIFDRQIALHMKEGDVIEYYGKISDLEHLAGSSFFRIHRAYLINLKYVKAYDSKFVLLQGASIPVARGKYQDLIKAFLTYNARRECL